MPGQEVGRAITNRSPGEAGRALADTVLQHMLLGASHHSGSPHAEGVPKKVGPSEP